LQPHVSHLWLGKRLPSYHGGLGATSNWARMLKKSACGISWLIECLILYVYAFSLLNLRAYGPRGHSSRHAQNGLGIDLSNLQD
jgi:hypothetical protein